MTYAHFRRLRGLLLVLLFSVRAHAAYEDIGFDARSIGMADAMTAVAGGISSMRMNPATVGQLRHSEVEAGARRLLQIPAGPTDLNGMALGAGVPLEEESGGGALGVSWSYDDVKFFSLDRDLALTYGTRSWREIGRGTLDVGMSVKDLYRTGYQAGRSMSKVAADVGAYWRIDDDKSLGLSVLNINDPSMNLGSFPDRAPAMLKLGYAQSVRGFLVAMDATKREPSAGYRSTVSAAFGAEHSFATVEHGSFAARTGLNLAGLQRAWSLGAGWRVLGAQLDYALRLPLSGGSRFSHAVSLSYRFGAWNPEAEYERMLSGEMRYRQDLSRALDASEEKQRQLGVELKRLKGELASLRKELATRAAESGEAKERLENAKKELRLKELEERRRKDQERLEQIQKEQEEIRRRDVEGRFRQDWSAYQELKRQGASDLVLIDRLQRILREYKASNVDLGEANQELKRLMAASP